MAKPDQKIFEYVLNDLRIRSDEAIFIDDKKENTRSAKELGIKSILFKNLDNLKKELAELEIF